MWILLSDNDLHYLKRYCFCPTFDHLLVNIKFYFTYLGRSSGAFILFHFVPRDHYHVFWGKSGNAERPSNLCGLVHHEGVFWRHIRWVFFVIYSIVCTGLSRKSYMWINVYINVYITVLLDSHASKYLFI